MSSPSRISSERVRPAICRSYSANWGIWSRPSKLTDAQKAEARRRLGGGRNNSRAATMSARARFRASHREVCLQTYGKAPKPPMQDWKVCPMPRDWFECWRDPSDFFCTAWQQIKSTIGSVQPQYIEEAYIAGLFACIWNYHNTCKIRLLADIFPDAQLNVSGHLIDLEIVTADRYGRKRWKEQKEIIESFKRGNLVPTDCPEKLRDEALSAIPRAVRKKAKRHYSTPPHLLVYSMIVQTPEVTYPLFSVDEMAALTEPYKANFESIWVLSGIENVMLWPERKILSVPSCQDPFNCPRSDR
jgi:hypothetical protein